VIETFAGGRVRSWGSLLDDPTRAQAETTARLPILAGPIALMPDAHLGKGATIGSVIPTDAAVIPAAVGVDIGCGMAARKLALVADHLPDDLSPWVALMRSHVPAGLGRWHREPSAEAREWFEREPPPPTLEHPERAASQLGTLGSGNHFIELALDETGHAWILLHSGSRGGGNRLAMLHTRTAQRLHERLDTPLEDPDLAWLREGTPEFEAYIRDLRWSQAFAAENRRLLLRSTQAQLEAVIGSFVDVQDEVDCHHNFSEREQHDGRAMWITRKGAIRARVGDRGLVPGSMGQASFVTRGLGDTASYESSAHGAGRLMSRRAARRTLSSESLIQVMGRAAWQSEEAEALLDEHPEAYKPLDVVMRDQADLVEIEHELHAIANYKGAERQRGDRRARRASIPRSPP